MVRIEIQMVDSIEAEFLNRFSYVNTCFSYVGFGENKGPDKMMSEANHIR